VGGAIGLAALLGSVSDDYVVAAFLALYVVVVVGYPTVFETLSRGRTLGKMALGLRVVGDDGSPVRFRQALVRSLTGLFEIWTYALAPVALITSIISAKGKRVGDMFAGTYVLQERVPARQPLAPEFTVVPFPLAGWARGLEVSGLSAQSADAAASYLRRYTELNPRAREALGLQLAGEVLAQVSPPPPAGTPPAAYLSAVLAVRRGREYARQAAARAALPQAWPGTATPPPPPAPVTPAAPPPPAVTESSPATQAAQAGQPAPAAQLSALPGESAAVPPGFAPPS
jgi:uncharacterized RDD family membrane protein YckC